MADDGQGLVSPKGVQIRDILFVAAVQRKAHLDGGDFYRNLRKKALPGTQGLSGVAVLRVWTVGTAYRLRLQHLEFR